MDKFPQPIDLTKVKVYPLSQRQSLSSIDKIVLDPAQPPPPGELELLKAIADCAEKITAARKRGASVILMYGAHLIKNGAQRLIISLLERGSLTHLATNGAGAIHDWELAYLSRTEESV